MIRRLQALQIPSALRIAGFAVLCAVLAPEFSARAAAATKDLGTTLDPYKKQIEDQKLPTCSQADYINNPSGMKNCLACQSTMKDLKTKLGKAADASTSKDGSITGLFGLSAAGQTNVTGQNNMEGNTANIASGAKTANLARSDNATDAKSQFQQCQKDVQDKCQTKLSTEDAALAQQLITTCGQAATATGDFAKDQKDSGMDMGDMSKMLSAAAQGLGAAAQLMQAMNQNQSQGTDSSITPPPPESTQMPTVSSSGTQSASLGNGSSGASQAPGGVGFNMAPTNTASATAGGNPGYSAGSGSGLSTNASGQPLATPGASAAAPGTSSGSGGGGSAAAPASAANAKGTAEETSAGGAAVAAEANPYEMSMGGGLHFGGSGGKGGKADALDGGDMAASLNDNGKSPLEDFGVRAPASATDAAASDDILANDEESIFVRVREKYSFLKGSGRI